MAGLMLGDCLERMKEIESLSVDLVLTDPPYGTTACKWDSVIPLAPIWEQVLRIAKNNAAIVLFGGEPFSSFLRCSQIRLYKYDWYWMKVRPVNFLNAKKQPMRKVEIISVFSKHPHRYFPQGLIANTKINRRSNVTETNRLHGKENISYFTNYPDNVLLFNSDRGLHPTQKPVELMEYLIKTYTNEGDIVLDFAMGSGTTGVACKNLNRQFIGIELDPKYFAIAKQRMGISGAKVRVKRHV